MYVMACMIWLLRNFDSSRRREDRRSNSSCDKNVTKYLMVSSLAQRCFSHVQLFCPRAPHDAGILCLMDWRAGAPPPFPFLVSSAYFPFSPN